MPIKKFLGGVAVSGFFVFCVVFGVRLSLTPTTAAEESSVSPIPTPNVESDKKKMFLKNLPEAFELPKDDTAELLLHEYGSVFLARNGAVPPKKVIFQNEKDVQAFQSSVTISSEKLGSTKIELQSAAMTALTTAIAEAQAGGLSITPRGGD